MYIAERSNDDPRFGLTKLNKILYFSDFKAYGLLGHSITGETYLRFDRGPVARHLLREIRELEDRGELVSYEKMYFNYRQRRVEVPSWGRQADTRIFSPDEILIVDQVLAELRHLNATEVSALSHLEFGWQVVASGEEIPYFMVFASDSQPTMSELDQAADWLASDDDEPPAAASA